MWWHDIKKIQYKTLDNITWCISALILGHTYIHIHTHQGVTPADPCDPPWPWGQSYWKWRDICNLSYQFSFVATPKVLIVILLPGVRGVIDSSDGLTGVQSSLSVLFTLCCLPGRVEHLGTSVSDQTSLHINHCRNVCSCERPRGCFKPAY